MGGTMVSFDKTLLMLEANRTGFSANIIEKVLHLIQLLNEIFDHSYLKDRLVLKGGTALNLFYFDLPRLSVDIDLNYVGSLDKDVMLIERKEIELNLLKLCRRLGYSVKRSATEHAGGKWRFGYPSSINQSGNIEVDISYMYRVNLWPIQYKNSYSLGKQFSKDVPVLDIHELGAGKFSALFSRSASRDLFDTNYLLTRYSVGNSIDLEKLRLAFVFYGAMARKDWREISISNISFDKTELKNKLFSVMSKSIPVDVELWLDNLLKKSQSAMSKLLPFQRNEIDFLDALLDQGEVKPELITSDKNLQKVIRIHPGILWKIHNVRKHKVERIS